MTQSSTIDNRFTPPLALTMGEPAGVGPDITLNAWRDRYKAGLPPFCLIGDPETLIARGIDVAPDVPVARPACAVRRAR